MICKRESDDTLDCFFLREENCDIKTWKDAITYYGWTADKWKMSLSPKNLEEFLDFIEWYLKETTCQY